MSAIAPSQLRPSTMAELIDLVDRLGGLPPSRIRLDPAPGTATIADALDAESRGWGLCELVDGVLVEKAMGYYESAIAAWLIYHLLEHVKQSKSGVVTGEAGMFRVAARKLRIPDVAYTVSARLPADRKKTPAPPIAPDLAVEILSPGNTEPEIELKRKEYFAAGSRLIWVIRPASRTVDVFAAGSAKPVSLDETGSLDGEDVLPGFSLSVGQLFAEADAQ